MIMSCILYLPFATEITIKNDLYICCSESMSCNAEGSG